MADEVRIFEHVELLFITLQQEFYHFEARTR